MTRELEKLIVEAKKAVPSAEEREQQRRSFAFGNTNIENARIKRETVDEQADALRLQEDERRNRPA